jgi:hypothetical protein
MHPDLSEWDVIGRSLPGDPGEPQHGSPRRSINEIEYEILSHVSTDRIVVEIGTGLGVSAEALAKRAKKVYTYDPDVWVAREIVPHLPTNVIPIMGTMGKTPEKCDVVFVDGDHSTDAVRNDIKNIRWNGIDIAIFHDVDEESVRRALEIEGVRWYRLSERLGFAIIR